VSKKKQPENQIELSQLRLHIKELQQQFVDQIPFNAWRFFTPCHSGIDFIEGDISFNEADYFNVNDQDFKECLEFWVTQAGGEVIWKMPKNKR
jgi:hypothetical protein